MEPTFILKACRELLARQADYRLYEDYEAGRHSLQVSLRKVREAFRHFFNDFRDNLCPLCIEAIGERLQVRTILDESGRHQEPLRALLAENRFDALQGRVHREALRAGDAYLIVWRDPERDRPGLYPQSARTMTVVRDENRPERLLGALKLWTGPEGIWRLTIYTEDRIERLWAPASSALPESLDAFRPYEADGAPALVPNPYGVVPVVAFHNPGGSGPFGVSELRDVAPLQDALNKTLLDMLVGNESQAMPQRYALGLEIERDDKGRPVNPFEKPGGVWVLGSENARLGQFDPADLGQMLAVVNDWRAAIARVSGVPLHYFQLGTGGWPSGEAMKSAEARLTAKVRARSVVFGNAWEDVAALALTMTGRSPGPLNAIWEDPAPRSERERLECDLLRLRLGYSKRQILRERGLSLEEIARMETETSEDPL